MGVGKAKFPCTDATPPVSVADARVCPGLSVLAVGHVVTVGVPLPVTVNPTGAAVSMSAPTTGMFTASVSPDALGCVMTRLLNVAPSPQLSWPSARSQIPCR